LEKGEKKKAISSKTSKKEYTSKEKRKRKKKVTLASFSQARVHHEVGENTEGGQEREKGARLCDGKGGRIGRPSLLGKGGKKISRQKAAQGTEAKSTGKAGSLTFPKEKPSSTWRREEEVPII